ncbi:hypothetical protein TCSYLVIO_005691 [Trypanosoma cruzi]|nr:hypothetical protein TCSYLVIO_005691 [Trypanosoma cruzi]
MFPCRADTRSFFRKTTRSILERAFESAGNRRRAHHRIVPSQNKERASVPICCSTHGCASAAFSRFFPNKSDDPRCNTTCPHNSWCHGCAPAIRGWFGRWSMPPALHKQQTSHEGNIAGAWPPRQYGQSTLGPRCGGRHCQEKGLQLGSSPRPGGQGCVPSGPPTRPVCGDDWLWFSCPRGLAINRDTCGADFCAYSLFVYAFRSRCAGVFFRFVQSRLFHSTRFVLGQYFYLFLCVDCLPFRLN